MKFKVGDRIRVKGSLKGTLCNVNGKMDKWCGKVMTIASITNFDGYKMLEDIKENNGLGWFWTDEMLEPVQQLNFDVNKYIGKAIHCDTEEKAKQLLEYLDGQGYEWISGRRISLTEKINWREYSENTCYYVEKNKKLTFDRKKNLIDINRDIIEFEDLLTDKPRMCEIIGKEVGEEFCIKNYFGNPCYINKLGEIRNSQGECVRASVLTRAVNHPENIQDVPTEPIYTDKQLEVFKMLKDVFHLNFVARDGNAFDNDLFGYVGKPVRCDGDDAWDLQPTMVELSNLDKDIFSFLKWEDKEPFDLAKALEIGK